jgi:ABC-type phosphate transport system substrate-binding protein
MLRCAALAALVIASLPVARDFTVVVHVDNEVGALTRAELSKLFLKRTTRWPSGASVVPVEIATSTVRESFFVAVHGKSVQAVKAYWNQLIFSGRDVPPLEKTSDEAVVAFVHANPNAVGVVSHRASTEGVKVIKVTD